MSENFEEIKLIIVDSVLQKLQYMRDKTKNEVGGFGISDNSNPLLVVDFVLVPQEVSGAKVDFDEKYLSTYYEYMSEKGIPPQRCARIWIHTHPFSGTTVNPSAIDNDHFYKMYLDSDWAIMLILGRETNYYCELWSKVFNGTIKIPVAILGTSNSTWDKEYDKNVREAPPVIISAKNEILKTKFRHKRLENRKRKAEASGEREDEFLGEYIEMMRGWGWSEEYIQSVLEDDYPIGD